MSQDRVTMALYGGLGRYSFESFINDLQNPQRTLLWGDLSFYFALLCILAILQYILSFYMFGYPSGRVKIVCQENSFNVKLKNVVQNTVGEYVAPWWYNRHLGSTIQFGKVYNLPYEIENIVHSDGSQFVVKWYPKKPSGSEASKICIFVPGLGSKSGDSYVSKFVQTLSSYNFHCAVVTARGLEHPLSNHKTWHPALHDDVCLLLERTHEACPDAILFMAGFSAGSNIVHNALLHKPEHIRLAGVFCCCVNWCYATTRSRLENSIAGKFYSFMLAALLKGIMMKSIQEVEKVHGSSVRQDIQTCRTMSEVDRVLVRVFGFTSETEQLNAFSALKRVHEKNIIEQPVLLLQPQDDPLHQDCVDKNIPVDVVTSNPHVIYMETSHGNHIGFVEGPLFEAFTNSNCYSYPAKVAAVFFQTIIEQKKT